jgi:hypothetical protein
MPELRYTGAQLYNMKIPPTAGCYFKPWNIMFEMDRADKIYLSIQAQLTGNSNNHRKYFRLKVFS